MPQPAALRCNRRAGRQVQSSSLRSGRLPRASRSCRWQCRCSRCAVELGVQRQLAGPAPPHTAISRPLPVFRAVFEGRAPLPASRRDRSALGTEQQAIVSGSRDITPLVASDVVAAEADLQAPSARKPRVVASSISTSRRVAETPCRTANSMPRTTGGAAVSTRRLAAHGATCRARADPREYPECDCVVGDL